MKIGDKNYTQGQIDALDYVGTILEEIATQQTENGLRIILESIRLGILSRARAFEYVLNQENQEAP